MQYSELDKTNISAGIRSTADQYNSVLIDKIRQLLDVTSVYICNSDRVQGPQTGGEFCNSDSLEKSSMNPWVNIDDFSGITSRVLPQYTGLFNARVLFTTPNYFDGIRSLLQVELLIEQGNFGPFPSIIEPQANSIYSQFDIQLTQETNPLVPSAQTGVYQRMSCPEIRNFTGLDRDQIAYVVAYGNYHNMSLYNKYSVFGVSAINLLFTGCGVLQPLRDTDDISIMNQQNAAGCYPYDSLGWMIEQIQRIGFSNNAVIQSKENSFNNTDELVVNRASIELDSGVVATPRVVELTWGLNRNLVPTNI